MKRLKICCSILMLCFSMMLFAGCDSKLASIQVIGNTVETNIAYGQTVDLEDFADLEVLATFEDGTSKIVSYAEAEADFEIDFSSIVSTTPGEYSVEITYQDVTTTITLTVAVAHITGFVIDRSGIPTTIAFGTTPTWSNLVVSAIYADESEVSLTSGFSVNTTTFNPNVAGTYTITVSYSTFATQTFTVQVLAPVVTGVELTTTNVKTTYLYNESLDLANLVVKARYSDNSLITLTTEDYTIDNDDFSATTPATYTITITYGAFSEDFDVTVQTAHITGFVIDRSGISETIGYGLTPNWSNLIVKKVYADGVQTALTTLEYSIDTSAYIATTAGTYTITVAYGAFTTQTFIVEVSSSVVTGIELDLTHVDQTLLYGTALDLQNDLVVKAVYDDETTTDLSFGEYEIAYGGFSATTPDDYTITITYNEIFTKYFVVTVAVAHITGFEVDSSAIPATVAWGTTPTWSGVVVKAVYADNTVSHPHKVVLTSGYSVNTTTFNPNVAGTYTITVSYGAFTPFTFTVEVLAPVVLGVELTTTNVKTAYLYGEELNLANLVVKILKSDNSLTTLTSAQYEITHEYNAIQSGSYLITVTYGDFSEEFYVTVAVAHITGFEVDSSAIPATVAWGTTPTWSGVVVSAVYADNTVSHPHKETLTSGYSVNTTTFNPNVAGTYTITVSYGSFANQTFTVQVLAPVVLGVELTTTNVKTAYLYGEELNLANLVVKILKSDNSLTTLTSEQYTVEEEYSATTPGTYEITIRYNEVFTASFDVSVATAHVVALSVDRSAIATSVSYGFVPNWDSIRVYEVYADNSQVEVEDYIIDTSNYSANEIGIHTISITYGSFSTSFDVNVKTATGTNNYVIEGETLVIYKGVSYSMGENVTQMSYIKEETETPVAISGSTFILYEFGNYTFSYLKDSVETTKAIKVVPWISAFGFGESISQFNSSINSDTTNFIATTDNTYKVGTGSYFYFDVLMNSGYLTSEDYITFAFQTKAALEDEYASVNKADIIISTTESEDYGTGFWFNPESTGLYVKATITPKYNNRTPIVMEFVLVDGVNVFSDAELKLAYGNLSVQNINIHRTIVCTLTANQTNADGISPLNYHEGNPYAQYQVYVNIIGTIGIATENVTNALLNARATELEFESISAGYALTDLTGNNWVYKNSIVGWENKGNNVQQGDFYTNNTGNVYARYSDSKTNDNLVINGNYQTINGSYLPLINLAYAGVNGQAGVLDVTDGIVNSQIAIFRSEVRDSSATITENTSLAFNTANNNNVTYNNLVIIGNTTVPEETQGSELYENSGSYSGIRSAYNDVETNNCLIMNTCIGLFIDQIGTDFVVKNTKIYESWSNLICGFHSNHVTLTNCVVKNAGGAAVWLEDNDLRDDDLYNPKFTMDTSTIIENFVAGTEAWFTSYNMAGLSTGIKSALNIGIAPYGKTILKNFTYEGVPLPVEKFNFSVVIIERFAAPTDELTRASGTFQIGNITVARNYGTTPMDPNESPFLCDVTTQAFRDRVTGLKGMGYTDTQAEQQAYIEQANYLEVVEDVFGFGMLHMITTIYGNNYLGAYNTSAELISSVSTALYYDHAYIAETSSHWYWNKALATPAWVNQKITQAAYDALTAIQKAAVPYIIVS